MAKNGGLALGKIEGRLCVVAYTDAWRYSVWLSARPIRTPMPTVALFVATRKPRLGAGARDGGNPCGEFRVFISVPMVF